MNIGKDHCAFAESYLRRNNMGVQCVSASHDVTKVELESELQNCRTSINKETFLQNASRRSAKTNLRIHPSRSPKVKEHIETFKFKVVDLFGFEFWRKILKMKKDTECGNFKKHDSTVRCDMELILLLLKKWNANE